VLVNGGAGAKVTADIEASNGIVHVIDAVLKLPTIVNQIKANPSLSSLLSVGHLSFSISYLKCRYRCCPLTVYAPNNDSLRLLQLVAFSGRTDRTTNILRYHLESGNRVQVQ
jgi:uncharacterized surface protein with fasciclin (FAS1) repeats